MLCVGTRKEFNSPRIFLVHQHGRRFIVSLFWNTNMAAVTSCENALYVLNSRSHTNDRHLRVTRCFIPLSSFEFLSLTFSLNFQLINFPLHERIHLYFSCPRPYNVSNGPRPRFIPNSYVAIYYHFSHSLKPS